MRVIHYIPSLRAVEGSAFLSYKIDLLRQMSSRADVMVVTSVKGCVQLGNASLEVFPPFSTIWRVRKRFKTLLTKFNPDVVHIHAEFGMSAYILFKQCRRLHIPVVISTDRRLEPWHAATLRQKLSRTVLITMKRSMLTDSMVLHAACQQEYDNLNVSGGYPLRRKPLNVRTVRIDAFTIVGTTTTEVMLSSMITLYRKAVDTSPFHRMNNDELSAEDWLIFKGATSGHIDVSADDRMDILSCLDGKAWHRIFLHAGDEGVTGWLLAGIKSLGLDVKVVDPTSVSRFSLRRPVSASVSGRIKRFMRRLKSYGLSGNEYNVCAAIISTAVKCRYVCVRRSDFVSLYQTLRFSNYDENSVACVMARLGLSRQAARLLCILGERYGLTEGFMFTTPLDDKGTETLRKKLFKSEIQ